jgi:hypothetical protein
VTQRTLEERFWSKVKTEGACWLWQGSTSGSLAYGQFRGRSHRPEFAHRVSWQLANGPIPDGAWVLHRCDVPRCVRPDHLYLGTPWDNAQDTVEAGRIRNSARGRKPKSGSVNGVEPASVVLTVRVSPAWVQQLDVIAAKDRSSRSDVIRRSVELYAARYRKAA